MDTRALYPACDHFDRKQPEVPITEELKDKLTKNYRVMPLYEKAISDHKFSRSHSLNTNKFLNCRWLEYQRINIAEKPPPFIFPHLSDIHFYNYDTRYEPQLSIRARPSHRFLMKHGPGVDRLGVIPTPSDASSFRRTGLMEHKKTKIKTKLKIPLRG